MADDQLPLPRFTETEGYSEPDFWDKLQRFASMAGYAVIEKALWLYYAAQLPETPASAKSVIYGALAYFILPVDTVPDFIPGAGYVDDLSVLAFAVLTISRYIDEEVKLRASETLARWF